MGVYKVADVIDVARMVLRDLGSASTMKLQKIVYYSQAYHLVEHDEALFDSRIEAWRNGPVVPSLYDRHAHEFVISDGFLGDFLPESVSDEEMATISRVVSRLKDKTGQELSAMTHSEDPWIEARVGLSPLDIGNKEITRESIKSYYKSRLGDHVVFSN